MKQLILLRHGQSRSVAKYGKKEGDVPNVVYSYGSDFAAVSMNELWGKLLNA